MEIVKRYTTSGIGWYFGEPIKRFDNVEIVLNFFGYKFVKFDYYGKTYIYKLHKGKYGLHFRFGNTTYYLKGGVLNA